MKKLFLLPVLLLLGLFFFHTESFSAAVNSSQKGPDLVPIGIFIASLYDINFTDESYTVVFWVWWKSKQQMYEPSNFLEVINAKEFECLTSYTLKDKGWYYMTAKYSAIINQNWLTQNYPFDHQNLKIVIESVKRDSTDVVFTPDLNNSTINRDIEFNYWKIGYLKLTTTDYRYSTGFGIQILKKEVFPRLIVTIPIQRIGYRIFIASFIGFIISFFITALLYFISPEDISSRLSLSMAALFATVGNKYTIDTTLPMGSTFSLADTIGISTFVIVIVSIFVTILCPWLVKKEKIKTAKVVNWSAFFLSCPVYAVLILYTVLSASR